MDISRASPAVMPEVRSLDRGRLERLRRIGWLLDSSIAIPRTRIRLGLDPLIGLVPGIGDLIGGLLSVYIVIEAFRMGVPRGLLARMGWNVALDALVGEVPVLGDLFDVSFKANLRNLDLLDGYLRRPAEARRSSRLFIALLVVGLLLLTAGAVALAVVLVHLLSGLLG